MVASFDRLLYSPMMSYEKELIADIALKNDLVDRYKKVIEGKTKFVTSHRRDQALLNEAERLLLSAKTSPLAAAQLQSIIKANAQKNGVKIKSTQIGKVEEMGEFSKISVKVVTESGIRGLTGFLHGLEAYPRLLKISRTTVRGHIVNDASRLNTTIIVKGLSIIK